MEADKKKYSKYVKEVTPTHPTWKNVIRAFLVGGGICLVGQIFLTLYMGYCKDKETAASWVTLTLIALSILFTGLNIYPKLTTYAGAGALVPITGFANSVVSPAIEYKAEGQVFGIGVKIFTIAGPVILYGIFASWILGMLQWLGKGFGWW